MINTLVSSKHFYGFIPISKSDFILSYVSGEGCSFLRNILHTFYGTVRMFFFKTKFYITHSDC